MNGPKLHVVMKLSNGSAIQKFTKVSPNCTTKVDKHSLRAYMEADYQSLLAGTVEVRRAEMVMFLTGIERFHSNSFAMDKRMEPKTDDCKPWRTDPGFDILAEHRRQLQ